MDSINEVHVENPFLGSPVVVTDETDRPVAIIKSSGDPTGLALATIAQRGLFKGMFFVPEEIIAPKRARHANASHAPIDKIGRCIPIRFSTFFVDTADKQTLGIGNENETDWQDLITNDISTLSERASQLLETAVPAELGRMRIRTR